MPADNQETLLVIEHDPETLARVRDALRAPERRLLTAGTAREGLALLAEVVPELVVADLDVPDLRGSALIEALRRTVRGLRIVGLTHRPSMTLGVQAVRAGAEDVLDLPLNRAMLHAAVDRALHESRSRSALARAREALADRAGLSRFLSRSPRMLRVFDQIRAVAGTDATVLIRGETGTGKELVSKAIHERSARQDLPFIAINCGAFTETLLESELFGHEKGSFTGAAGRRRGVFEMADGGTLFLDELGETSLNVQVTLLRVLEEMRFRRVGGHDLVPVDVRIVAATNVDLETAVEDGEFRQDLYYRLNVFPIHLPPLRERPEDIPLLTRHFLEDAAQDYGLGAPALTPEAMACITRYAWPGNVRQLRALCERWVIQGAGGQLDVSDLPPDMTGAGGPVVDGGGALLDVDPSIPMKAAVERVSAEVERRYLQRVLRLQDGHLTKTAQAAGITRRTLYTKMKAYGLDAGDFRRGS